MGRKKKQHSKPGMLARAARKAQGAAGSAVQVGGAVVAVEPLLESAAEAVAAGQNDLLKGLTTFAHSYSQKTGRQIAQGIAGIILIVVGQAMKSRKKL
jgi:uncharacterized membrane protein HdeD (DUF308 family)